MSRLLSFIAVISCISAEHPQMKSSRARFRKLVHLGKASIMVCLFVLVNCQSYVVPTARFVWSFSMSSYELCFCAVCTCLCVTSNFCSGFDTYV